MENTADEPRTIRPKLSFSSTTSILSAEEQSEDDGPLTPIERMEDDVEDEDDDLSELNSILQAGSPGSLSDEEVEDLPTEHDSASSLSSVPDDFPLSPEIPSTIEEEEEESTAFPSRKRDRKEEDTISNDNNHTDGRPIKKMKSLEENSQKEPSKKRNASNASLDIPDVPRTRRKSRQEDKDVVLSIQDKKDISEEEDTLKKDITADKTEETADDSEAQDENTQDYQQRHKEALDALTQIEIEFAKLRDRMYQEKMSELNEEAIMIANGTHPELVSLLAESNEKRHKRVRNAHAWKLHQEDNYQQQFKGFEYQANIHFMSGKNGLRRALMDSLNGKKWTIESEKSKFIGVSEFPDGREIGLRKIENKEETNQLQDIKEMLGFPMAPVPSGLSRQDMDHDLKLLGLLSSSS